MKLTNITNTSCSAVTKTNGVTHRKAYMNTEQGRAEFMAECADAESYAEVLEAWGDTPVDTPLNSQPYPQTTQEERITALEAQLAAYEAAYAEGVNEA